MTPTEIRDLDQIFINKVKTILQEYGIPVLAMTVDENEYVTVKLLDNTEFEYSIAGDNRLGILSDTIRALKREELLEQMNELEQQRKDKIEQRDHIYEEIEKLEAEIPNIQSEILTICDEIISLKNQFLEARRL